MNKLWVLVGMGMGIVIGIAIVGLKLTHAPALAVPGQDGARAKHRTWHYPGRTCTLRCLHRLRFITG